VLPLAHDSRGAAGVDRFGAGDDGAGPACRSRAGAQAGVDQTGWAP